MFRENYGLQNLLEHNSGARLRCVTPPNKEILPDQAAK